MFYKKHNHIYTHVCIHIWTYTYVYILRYEQMLQHLNICSFFQLACPWFLKIALSFCMRAHVCVCVCACVCVCVHVCTSANIYMHMCSYMYVSTCVHVRIIHARMYIDIHHVDVFPQSYMNWLWICDRYSFAIDIDLMIHEWDTSWQNNMELIITHNVYVLDTIS